MTKVYRQGDVLLRQVPTSEAAGRKPFEIKGKRATVAFGEATGHKHNLHGEITGFTTETAELFVAQNNSRGRLTELDYILVGGSGAVLKHEFDSGAPAEHKPIMLDPGSYQIAAQVEYQPGELRIVAD